ncbi:MAG: Snf7 family protein [Promethearchaeota archaeon]
MGSIKKFADWLSGGKNSKNTATTSITKIKVFIKRLQRQSAKLQNQAKIAKRKAVELRKKGDIAGSRLHMRSALQNEKWAHGIDNFILQIQSLQFKLEQAKAVEDVGKILESVAVAIKGLQNAISAPQISDLVEQIDLGIQDFDVTQEITETGLEAMNVNTEVSDEEVDQALAEVDTEISIETGQALPSAGDSKIKELEQEIQRLKEGK